MQHRHYLTAIAFMIFSASGLALTGLFAKIGFQSLTLPSLIFWRFFSATLICLLVYWVSGRLEWSKGLGDMKMHFLRAFFVLSSQYSFYYYLEYDTLLNAVVLLNTGPLFIPIFERIFLRREVEKATWIGLAISFVGVLCVLQPGDDIFTLISFIGLFAGLTQGASQVVFGLNSKKERSQIGVLVLLFLCAAFSLIPYLIEGVTFNTGYQYDVFDLYILLGLGAASVCNQLFRASAYELGTPSKLAAFLYFSVILAGIFDWAIFHKVPNALSLVGAALVISGGLFKIYFHYRSARH